MARKVISREGGLGRFRRAALGLSLGTIVWACGLLGTRTARAMPEWVAKDGQRRIGSFYEVVCSGKGPDIDLARQEALRACAGFAARQLPAPVQVSSLTVESEDSVAFHQEIAEKVRVNGLVCRPSREQAEEQGGEITLWVRCQYDLARVALLDSLPESIEPASLAGGQDQPAPRKTSAGEAGVVFSPRRSLTLTTVPPCDSILVQGAKPRVVRCAENPVSLVVEPEDRQMIVRARDYQPRTLDLGPLREKPGDVVQVLLDRM